jgi:hypothetical protein
MDKDKTSIERTVLFATSIVGGIGGLFTAINGLSDSVRKTVGIFSAFNEWQLGIAALALVAFSWWLFRLSRAFYSDKHGVFRVNTAGAASMGELIRAAKLGRE